MKIAKEIFLKFVSWFQDTRFRIYDLVFLFPYAGIIGFGIWHHEPWSDEALPWMIARDSTALEFIKIIFENWDRHPGLFHTILIPFAKLGLPFWSQAVLNFLLSLTSATLFLVRAPFSRMFRILFLLSFYMLYEYSVITRPYMLVITLLFIIATVYSQRSKYPFLYAILVGLLFHSDYMGFGLAAGLTAAFFLEQWPLFPKNPRVVIAFGFMAFNAALIFWMGHSLPPGHGEYGLAMPFRFLNIIKPLANAFFPFCDMGRYQFFTFSWAILSGCITLILVGVILIRKPISAIIFGASLGFLFLVFAFFQGGNYRNHGFILMTVIFCLWITRTSQDVFSEPRSKWQKFQQQAARGVLWLPGICILLGFQNLVYAYQLEYFLPFAGNQRMAAVIKKLDSDYGLFKNGYIIVAPHKNSVGLQPYLPGVKFWNPCAGGYVNYYTSSHAMKVCNELPEIEALKITRYYFPDLRRVLLLFRNPLPIFEDEHYVYRQVFSVPQVFGYWYETFFLYRAFPKPSVEGKVGFGEKKST